MARRSPLPGRRVRGSATGRPVIALLDLLGQRWTLRIMWELRDGTVLNFRKLQERCDDLSPAVQNDRLAKLREAGIVEHAADEGYKLTPDGVRLARMLNQLNAWADDWAKRLK
ncbi:MAG: winged helix-turn-helix transcriptional regulator [Steroidobacteraceae bacterium]